MKESGMYDDPLYWEKLIKEDFRENGFKTLIEFCKKEGIEFTIITEPSGKNRYEDIRRTQ